MEALQRTEHLKNDAVVGEALPVQFSQKIGFGLVELGQVVHAIGHFDDAGAAHPFCTGEWDSGLLARFGDRGAVGEVRFFLGIFKNYLCHRDGCYIFA